MAKTAFELTTEEWRSYRPLARNLQHHREEEVVLRQRRDEAWDVARAVAAALRQRFGATRVAVFGSLTRPTQFTRWSDIDLAVWGIPADRSYQAVAAVAGLSPHFKIDLVDIETCRPALREVIEQEGVAL
ncbi:MAG: nucleotidyltransferase family protein [Blastocatellia bacterium]